MWNFSNTNSLPDLTQLTELFNEIREMCEGEEGEVVASGSSISNNDDIGKFLYFKVYK